MGGTIARSAVEPLAVVKHLGKIEDRLADFGSGFVRDERGQIHPENQLRDRVRRVRFKKRRVRRAQFKRGKIVTRVARNLPEHVFTNDTGARRCRRPAQPCTQSPRFQSFHVLWLTLRTQPRPVIPF